MAVDHIVVSYQQDGCSALDRPTFNSRAPIHLYIIGDGDVFLIIYQYVMARNFLGGQKPPRNIEKTPRK